MNNQPGQKLRRLVDVLGSESHATVRLAGSEIHEAWRRASRAADTPELTLGRVADLASQFGDLTHALTTGNRDDAFLAIRRMQAALEDCRADLADESLSA